MGLSEAQLGHLLMMCLRPSQGLRRWARMSCSIRVVYAMALLSRDAEPGRF